MASSQGAVQMAMMVDIIPGDMREQGFPILALFNIPSALGVLVLGYFLLALHLDSYVIFWIISFSTDTICLIGLLLLLPESMPDQLRKPLTCLGKSPAQPVTACDFRVDVWQKRAALR